MRIFYMRLVLENFISVWDTVQEMAWQASFVILLVLLCRLFIGRVSKQANYILWLVVALRLLCPMMLPSSFSIFNFVQMPKTWYSLADIVTQGETVERIFDLTDNNNGLADNSVGTANEHSAYIPDEFSVPIDNEQEEKTKADNDCSIFYPSVQSVTTQNSNTFFANHWDMLLWIAGIAGMLGYGIYSYIHLKHKLRFATKLDGNVYENDRLLSPFIFGLVNPRIYLPYHLTETERSYVLQHERYHIKRRDYLVKFAAFGILSIYWFHPLVWVAFYFMCRDMEMSCDEQVLKEFGLEERKAYSTLLLSFASHKRFPLSSPLSFGENNVKSRIKQILKYQSPTLLGMAMAATLIFVLSACCLTNEKNPSAEHTDNTEEENSDNGAQSTDSNLSALAEALYEAKNPYIGNMPANGAILNLLKEHYGITGTAGTELQTTNEPYWITIDFNEKPNDTAMWKLSAMFLALVENADEIRWTFYDTNERMVTYYVTTDSVNKSLVDNGLTEKNLKEYVSSSETIQDLLQILAKTKLPISSDETINAEWIGTSNWEYYANESGINFADRINWENRMIEDGITYRGELGNIRSCQYKDFDKNGIMDLVIAIWDTNWDDDIESKLYIYINDDPVYVRELPVVSVFWDVATADMDNDGYTEFIFSGDTGGTGGYGFNAVFDILEYNGTTFEVLPLPTDEYLEWSEDCHAGFGVEVRTTKDEGYYEAYCPTINESRTFHFSETAETLSEQPAVGTVIGRERYGFDELSLVVQDGITYVLAKEFLYRTNPEDYHGMEDIGTACFLISWSDTEGWIIYEYTVSAVANDVSNEENIEY